MKIIRRRRHDSIIIKEIHDNNIEHKCEMKKRNIYNTEIIMEYKFETIMIIIIINT